MSVRHVNLLDQEAAGPGQTELNYLSILIVIGVIIVGCLGFTLWQKYNLSVANKQLSQISSEVAHLNASASSKQKKVADQEALLKTVRPISWSRLLKEVSHAIPASIQVSQVTGTLTEKRHLVISGSTHMIPAIFTLKDSLSKLPACEKASITNINQATFQMECQIQ